MAINWDKIGANASAKDAATRKVATADYAKTKPLVFAPEINATKNQGDFNEYI